MSHLAPEVGSSILTAVMKTRPIRTDAAAHQGVASDSVRVLHSGPGQAGAVHDVFSCLRPAEPQLLLEEVTTDLVAAGQHDPGPGGQEVPVHLLHGLRVVHQAASCPQGVSVYSLDISENRNNVLCAY